MFEDGPNNSANVNPSVITLTATHPVPTSPRLLLHQSLLQLPHILCQHHQDSFYISHCSNCHTSCANITETPSTSVTAPTATHPVPTSSRLLLHQSLLQLPHILCQHHQDSFYISHCSNCHTSCANIIKTPSTSVTAPTATHPVPTSSTLLLHQSVLQLPHILCQHHQDSFYISQCSNCHTSCANIIKTPSTSATAPTATHPVPTSSRLLLHLPLLQLPHILCQHHQDSFYICHCSNCHTSCANITETPSTSITAPTATHPVPTSSRLLLHLPLLQLPHILCQHHQDSFYICHCSNCHTSCANIIKTLSTSVTAPTTTHPVPTSSRLLLHQSLLQLPHILCQHHRDSFYISHCSNCHTSCANIIKTPSTSVSAPTATHPVPTSSRLLLHQSLLQLPHILCQHHQDSFYISQCSNCHTSCANIIKTPSTSVTAPTATHPVPTSSRLLLHQSVLKLPHILCQHHQDSFYICHCSDCHTSCANITETPSTSATAPTATHPVPTSPRLLLHQSLLQLPHILYQHHQDSFYISHCSNCHTSCANITETPPST